MAQELRLDDDSRQKKAGQRAADQPGATASWRAQTEFSEGISAEHAGRDAKTGNDEQRFEADLE